MASLAASVAQHVALMAEVQLQRQDTLDAVALVSLARLLQAASWFGAIESAVTQSFLATWKAVWPRIDAAWMSVVELAVQLQPPTALLVETLLNSAEQLTVASKMRQVGCRPPIRLPSRMRMPNSLQLPWHLCRA